MVTLYRVSENKSRELAFDLVVVADVTRRPRHDLQKTFGTRAGDGLRVEFGFLPREARAGTQVRAACATACRRGTAHRISIGQQVLSLGHRDFADPQRHLRIAEPSAICATMPASASLGSAACSATRKLRV